MTRIFFVLNLLNSTCSASILRNTTLHGLLAWSLNQRDLLCLEKLQKSVQSFGSRFPPLCGGGKLYGKQMLQGRNEVTELRESSDTVAAQRYHNQRHTTFFMQTWSFILCLMEIQNTLIFKTKWQHLSRYCLRDKTDFNHPNMKKWLLCHQVWEKILFKEIF